MTLLRHHGSLARKSLHRLVISSHQHTKSSQCGRGSKMTKTPGSQSHTTVYKMASMRTQSIHYRDCFTANHRNASRQRWRPACRLGSVCERDQRGRRGVRPGSWAVSRLVCARPSTSIYRSVPHHHPALLPLVLFRLLSGSFDGTERERGREWKSVGEEWKNEVTVNATLSTRRQ